MDIKELIFNLYKDKVMIAQKFKREVMKKFNIDKDDLRDLFVRINNYQVKNYGGKLSSNDIITSREEMKQNAYKMRCKKHQRRKNYNENTKLNRKFDYL